MRLIPKHRLRWTSLGSENDARCDRFYVPDDRKIRADRLVSWHMQARRWIVVYRFLAKPVTVRVQFGYCRSAGASSGAGDSMKFQVVEFHFHILKRAA